MYHEKLFRTWGEYCDYPLCCIEEFIKRYHKNEQLPNFYFTLPSHGSGFVPCGNCAKGLLGKSRQEFIDWLGRDPWVDNSGCYLKDYKNTLATTYEGSFINIAGKYKLDLRSYREFLTNEIDRIESTL